ncbi:MAG: serine--tRNA ligase [Cyanobacterium sp. T60_A2020_053]|nr:serine--tRNA ligase [Cyanobacterium sp. T60_A2020_053]
MLDLKQIRENSQQVLALLQTRNNNYSLQELIELDKKQREIQGKVTELQARSNEIGKLIGQKMRQGSDPKGEEIISLKEEGNHLKTKLADLEPQEKELKAQIEAQLLELPNLPSDTTPRGKSEAENVEIRRWGDEYKPNLPTYSSHDQIGENLGIINSERAVKVAQSRFVALVGAGARLERALISFMLDTQTKAGYVEVMPPILINTESLQGTGQLPKFAEESFKCEGENLWLTPTAEVPLTNFYRQEIIDSEMLPIYHCAYTPCFRREAGSYGKDVKGLIRLHQFNKVELVKIVHPDTSALEHEKMVNDAEAILQALKLPYRVLELCTGDLGFSATKCYDLEVWLPSSNQYREISSCSNCGDFQGRRADIRFREKGKKGTQYVHTLNGSGLAVGRAMAAILENYQQPDGTVKVPDVLQPYLHTDVIRGC